MNKAFLFDMDGVLVNSEQQWYKHGEDFFNNLFGKEIRSKLGELTGMSIDDEYNIAKSHGFTLSKDEFFRRYDKQALQMYAISEITENIDILLKYLMDNSYKIGVVSSSRKLWIDQVLSRIDSRDHFDFVLSLNERQDLRPKPQPDGYFEAMKVLQANHETTIILEDSNSGIKAAKATGAFTIAYTQHLIPNYVQIDADTTAKDISEVIEIIKRIHERKV